MLRGLGAAAAALTTSPPFARGQTTGGAVADAAERWLRDLSADQRRRAQFPFADGERFDWHYVPRRRDGLPLKEMNDRQQALALAIVDAGLSSDGVRKTTDVIRLEAVLREIETFGLSRDPGAYHLTVFGSPSLKGVWAWRLEGHHLSLNMAYREGDLAGPTPCFFGANPAIVPSGPLAGHQMMQAEIAAAHALLRSLDAAQVADAVIAERALGDIVAGPGREGALATPAGIAATRLSGDQQALLGRLIERFVGVLPEAERRRELLRVRGAGLAGIRFAWAGSRDLGGGHYFRVHGARILIEYDNSRNDANHVHSLWLDPENPFGRDVLGAHYRHGHRHG